MISLFRRYLETWPVRAFFGLMVVTFVVWGVGDVINVIGTKTWLVKVGGQTIEPQQFQPTFQRELAQAQRKLPQGQDMTPAERHEVANNALQQMIGQVAMADEEARLRVVVPDAMVRQAVFAMPAFRDSAGKFDRSKLDAALRSNGLSEGEFLSIVRGDLARTQIVDAVAAGALPPNTLTRAVYTFETERRSASMVELPFAAAQTPPAPSETELRRWYADHPGSFRIPEYRRIKAIVLSPDTIAKSLDASDADLRAWYDAHKTQFSEPARRSMEVAILPDQAKAAALATQWQGGADWATVQKAAEAAGGSGVALDAATEAQIPDAALATAAFAATPDQVAAPVKASLGWAVLRVASATPGHEQSFEQAKAEVQKRVLAEQASALLYDRVSKVDDVLGTGNGLDKLPPDLGLVGVSGTMDAQGNTEAGTPAPIPGPPELRKALIAAAFARQPGPPSEMTEAQVQGAGSAFYAVEVEQVIAPSVKPFDAVRDQVTADWLRDAREKAQEKVAAAMLTAVKDGESLADAAAKAGASVRTTPLVSRDTNAEGMPTQLQSVLFGLKKGEPAMVQTPEAFVVAVPDKIETPDPKTDPTQYATVRDVLTRSMAADLAQSFVDALRLRAGPQINRPVLDGFVQQ
ncbi:MAG: peptidyl-prolyl cis-trans isomerase [Acetobacteraceae bacterium]